MEPNLRLSDADQYFTRHAMTLISEFES